MPLDCTPIDRRKGIYHIINRRTGCRVGTASTLRRAIRIADRRDNEYGAYVHWILDVETGRDVTCC
jgi:hypothetical protein